MKKTAVVAIIVVALVFGAVAWASAANTDTETVTVSATINPAFDLSVDTNTVAFGALDLGNVETATGPVVTVRSNKTYTYTETPANFTSLPAAAAGDSSLIDAAENQSHTVAQGTEGARGVFKANYTYSLDLTGDAAYDIEAGDYEWEYVYTAVQD